MHLGDREGREEPEDERVRAPAAGGSVPGGKEEEGASRAGSGGTSLSQEPVAKVSTVCRLPGGTGRQRVLLIFCDTNLA